MLFIFIGQSATGKSTVGEKIKDTISAEFYSNNDYIKLARNKDEAWKRFMIKLEKATENEIYNIIYVVTDIELYDKVKNINGAIKVKFEADIETLKYRIAKRLNLQPSKNLDEMLDETFKKWNQISGDLKVDTSGATSPDEVGGRILRLSRCIVSYMHIDEEWRI